VPLEAINLVDSIPYVYKRDGTKQIVVLGSANDNHVIIEHGLAANDRVYLTTPSNPDNYRLVGEDLIAVIAEKKEMEKSLEAERRAEEERVLQEREARLRELRTNGGNGQAARPSNR
jgi:HlyD family secretion protein